MITELKLEFRFNPQPHVISSVLQRQFKVELLEAGCSQSIVDRTIIPDEESCVNQTKTISNIGDNQTPLVKIQKPIGTPLPPLPGHDHVLPPSTDGD